MFAAVFVTPSSTTDGIPMPIGSRAATVAPSVSMTARLIVRMIAGTTTSGVDGWGVATRSRGPASVPRSTSTTAALIPLPPTSTPTASRLAFGSVIVRSRSEVVDGDPTVDDEVRAVGPAALIGCEVDGDVDDLL